jgi:DNA-binding transcriptional regulator LsrR (DeoR family)
MRSGLSEDKMPRRKQARHTNVKDIRSILRLTFEQGLSICAVSERLKISKTSISTYLLRAREAGLAAWAASTDLHDDEVLEERQFREWDDLLATPTNRSGRRLSLN